MKRVFPLFLGGITLVLIILAWFTSGGVARREMRQANTPEQAVRLMLSQIQGHNFDAAYARLSNRGDVDKNAFIREFNGSYGSLLTYSSLENFDIWGLHSSDQESTMRVRLHYSTGVGPLDDVRDVKVQKSGDTWKVFWPVNNATKLPPQVIPVNYLRWDVIGRGAGDEWGVQNVDTPQVRILSMNAIQRPDGVTLVGEVVNEDSVPAFVNVGATLLDHAGNEIAQESSFDKIAHTLLPKQVSPYRIDFPNMRMEKIKNVRMDAKALLAAASADPVIEVNQQKVETDPLGKKVLSGQLTNEGGQVVDIPHVIVSYYDSNGKVVWVSDGYVAQPLLPQVPVPFAVDLPADISKNVQSYHVVVNHFDRVSS
ncbi:MAG: hypothetical protein DMG92_08560 [Acidobacteria bacterium]|nr:MAG: hypothetical protein DMG92_08560 [Acidobacteriota bacterium]